MMMAKMKFCSEYGATIMPDNICKKCGEKLANGVKFCGDCGEKV
jgi:ribosomal protein L32